MSITTRKIHYHSPLNFKKALRLAEAFRKVANGNHGGILCYGIRRKGWDEQSMDSLYPKLQLDLFLSRDVRITAYCYNEEKDETGSMVLVDRISAAPVISIDESRLNDLQKFCASHYIDLKESPGLS